MQKHRGRMERRAYELFLAAGLSFLACFYLLGIVEDLWLQEKVGERENLLNTVADRVDLNTRLDGGAWREVRLQDTIADLDEQYMTFAELFRFEDGVLSADSRRSPSYEGAPFEPLTYPEFEAEVMRNFENRDRAFTTRLWWEADGVAGRWMYVTWRWTPSVHGEVSFLMVTAISKYSLGAKVPATVYIVPTLFLLWQASIGLRVMRAAHKMAAARLSSQYHIKYGEGGDADAGNPV